jgi:ABC-type Fe3+ transport system permease subunit
METKNYLSLNTMTRIIRWVMPIGLAIIISLPVLALLLAFFPHHIPPHFFTIVYQSISLAIGASLLSTLITLLVLPWASQKTIWALSLRLMSVIPFFMPPHLVAGFFQTFFTHIFNIVGYDLRGQWLGLIIAHGWYEAPLMIFLLVLPWQHSYASIKSLVHIDHLSRWHIFITQLKIVMPQIKRVFLLTSLYTLQSNILVISLGQGRYDTLETKIFMSLNQWGTMPEIMFWGLTQMVLLWSGYHIIKPSIQSSHLHTTLDVVPPVSKLNYLWGILYLILWGLLLKPLWSISGSSFSQLWHALHVLQLPLISSMIRSIILASLVATITMILASMSLLQWHNLSYNIALFFSPALYSTGLIFISITLRLAPYTVALWGYVIMILPIASFSLQHMLAQQPRALQWLIKSDGLNAWQQWRHVWWPLYHYQLLLLWCQSFAWVMGEYTLASLLTNTHFYTASYMLNQLLSKRLYHAAIAYTSILLLCMLLPLIMLQCFRQLSRYLAK